MKVYELIEKLKKLPQNYECLIEAWGVVDLKSIKEIKVDKRRKKVIIEAY